MKTSTRSENRSGIYADSSLLHRGPISGIAASERYIATAGYDNQLILWEAQSKTAVARSLHDHLVNHCAFSASGQLLVSASSDYSARIWEVPSLRLKAALLGHSDDVDMAVFSPDDQYVATCALDRTVRIFDLEGHCLKIMRGHTGNILSLVWSHNGSRLVSSSVDGTIREWDVAGGTEVRCNNIDGVRTDTLVIDASGCVFAGDDMGRIVIIRDGRLSYVQAHVAGVKKIVFDEAARRLVTLSYDQTMAIWQVTETAGVREIARSDFPALVWPRSGVFIGPDRVAVGTFGSSYAVFDWISREWDLQGVFADSSLNAVAVANDACYAIGDAGTLFRNGERTMELGSLCNFILEADNVLLCGGQLGRLYNARSGAVLYQHRSPLNCGAYFLHRGRRHVVVGAYTGEALVFALDDDDRLILVSALKIYDNAIKGLAVGDGCIFSVCASTAIAWHDLASLKLIRLIPSAHERIANGCCMAGPGGFASVGRDLKLRLWMGDREEVYQTPHKNSVKCIAASDDGQTLMTGAYTGTLAGFDMAAREWRSFSRPTSAGISSLAYDRRERHFLASSYDGRIYAVR